MSEGITLADDFFKRIMLPFSAFLQHPAPDKRRRQTHGFDKAALSCQAALGGVRHAENATSAAEDLLG